MSRLVEARSLKRKNNLKLCSVDNNEMSVFEKQLSLINSSSLGLKQPYPQYKPSTRYYSHSPASSNSSGSTLIESPVHRYAFKSSNITSPGILKPFPTLNSNSPALKRTSSIHLRIPLFIFIKSYQALENSLLELVDCFKKAYEESSEFAMDFLALATVVSFAAFGAELLEFKKHLFFVGVIIFILSGLKILGGESSILLRGSVIELLQDREDLEPQTKITISGTIVGFQTLLFCSLIRVIAVFKNRHMEITSKLDHLSLIVLASCMIFMSLSLLQYSVPGAIHFSALARREEKPE